jgi:arginine exporter protein ArgO
VVYFSVLVLGGQAGQDRSLVAAGLFVAAAFVASASWQLRLAAGGSVLGRVLSGPRGRLGTALVSSAVILVLALRLALTAWPAGRWATF